MTPLDAMIAQTCRCVLCGATIADGCDCWVRLRCRACGRTKMTEREPNDPPGDVTIELTCPDCTETRRPVSG